MLAIYNFLSVSYNGIMPATIKINEKDTVVIALRDLRKGEKVEGDVILLEDIPQAHKIALCDREKGAPVIRYGVVLGFLTQPIRKGEWINEHKMAVAPSPDLASLVWGTDVHVRLPHPRRTTWRGYSVPGQRWAGSRNILAITSTVQCCQGVVDAAVRKMKEELLAKYPHVDDIVALNHVYGCGIDVNAPGSEIPVRTIRNLMHNPNFGGQLFVVSLGCEHLRPDLLLSESENNLGNVIVLQKQHGFAGMLEAMMEMAEKKLAILESRRREELPLSRLLVGFQCGGSDAFSGIAANPAAGYASDLLVSEGAGSMFSEVTEVRDGADKLAARCIDEATFRKLVHELDWYDKYLARGGMDRDGNPTPGNKAGGLSNIVEKAMGSIAKSGSAPIVDVLASGERATKGGLMFAATSANDVICGPSQLASGMALEVFMTGRGTPYGLAEAPVIKVSTRHELKEMWPDLIDIDAGYVETGEKTIQEVGEELFNLILDVASGEKPKVEQLGLSNYICLLNPAPLE